jgi:hypothetical protein
MFPENILNVPRMFPVFSDCAQIYGDVNNDGVISADGDIIVWGRLRGEAHAGVNSVPHL